MAAEQQSAEQQGAEQQSPDQQGAEQQGAEQQGAEQQGTEQQGPGQQGAGKDDGRVGLDRTDESQDFVDQSKIDFDPDEGLYSGTAVEGGSEIPGPHLDADSGELTGMDEAKQMAEEAGIAPDDTPAAKSPVARAAEAKNNGSADGEGEGSESSSEEDSAESPEDDDERA